MSQSGNNITAALATLFAGVTSSDSLLQIRSTTDTDAVLCVTQFSTNANVAGSMLYSIIHLTLGAILIGGILSYFSASSIEQSETWFQDAEDDKLLAELNERYARTSGSFRGRVAYSWGVAKVWVGDHCTSVMAWCALVVWLLFGAVIFEINEGGARQRTAVERSVHGLLSCVNRRSIWPNPRQLYLCHVHVFLVHHRGTALCLLTR